MRTILYFNGVALIMLAFCMIPSIFADLYFEEGDWLVFFSCLVITTFFGGCLVLGNTATSITLTRRDSFTVTCTIWLSLSIFGALPFYMSSLDMNPADSLFESVSGITTTGATVIDQLHTVPAGILIWRAMLQWLGGLAIIVMAMTMLPYLKIGGMQVFRSELSLDNKTMPRMKQRILLIFLIYLVLSLCCALGYMLAGMQVFDSIAHAMTTISTGGFSTNDESLGYYNNFGIELVAILFMLAGSLPFVLYIGASNGYLDAFYRDSQVRVFMGIVFTSVVIIFFYLVFTTHTPHFTAFRQALFNTVSVITGTGFFTTNYNAWGHFCFSLFLFMMVIGGCSASTTGGIKVFRFQVLLSIVRGQLQKLIYPHSVYIPSYNGRPLSPDVPMSVLSFFFAYALCFLLVALCLSFTGLDVATSLAGAIATVSNAGVGMGDVLGPGQTYEGLTDLAKFVLCLGMLVGRVEVFLALVMLSPYFWRD